MLFSRRKRHVTRILIVEDEPLVAFDNEMSLRAHGYEVVATVDRCADAIAILDTQAVDLVMTDIALTGVRSGLDVARYAAGKGVPVLFVSGTCPAPDDAPALGCLAKPYNDRTLKLALEAVDRRLAGETTGKTPPGLIFYETADSRG
jgi:DNA-binding response OmpR family regulator